MREAFQNMFTVLDKLLRDQLSNYPDIVRECIGGVLRYGLLTVCIFAGVLAAGLIYSLCAKKKSTRVLVAQGAVLALCVVLLIWAFWPVSLAQTGEVETARLQTVIYRDAATVRAEEEAAAESAAQAEAETGAETDNDASSGANSTSEEDPDEAEEEAPVTGMVAVITDTQELTAAQAQSVLALLEAQKGVRTVRAKLPEQSRSNLVLRFENGESCSVSLLEDSGYYYITETSDFLYSITDYDAFSAALRAIVQ